MRNKRITFFPFLKVALLALLLVLFAVGGYSRINRLNYGIHAWKQAEIWATIQNYHDDSPFPLYPYVNNFNETDASRRQVLGLPLYEYVSFLLTLVKGQTKTVARVVNLWLFAAVSVLVFAMVRRKFGYPAGILTVVILNVFPPSLFWSSSVLPDVTMIFLSLSALFILQSRRSGRREYIASAGLFGTALAIKVTAVGLLLPAVYLLRKYHQGGWGFRTACIWLSFSVLPVLLYNLLGHVFIRDISHIPTFFDYTWHPEFLQTKEYIGMLFTIAERVVYEQLTPLFFIVGLIGLYRLIMSRQLFFVVWLVGSIVSIIAVLKGNYDHNYYQLVLIPPAAIVVGCGFLAIWEYFVSIFGRTWVAGAYAGVLLCTVWFIQWDYIPAKMTELYWPETYMYRYGGEFARFYPVIDRSRKYIVLSESANTVLLNDLNVTGWVLNADGDANCLEWGMQQVEKYKKLGATAIVSFKYKFMTAEATLPGYACKQQLMSHVPVKTCVDDTVFWLCDL